MTPEQLKQQLTALTRAADVVEAIDNRDLQRKRGWGLSDWKYQLVPWGVRFSYQGPKSGSSAEIVAVMVLTGQGGGAATSGETVLLLG